MPWRIVLITNNDIELLDTNTPYSLAPECRLTDTSWIRPGKVLLIMQISVLEYLTLAATKMVLSQEDG